MTLRVRLLLLLVGVLAAGLLVCDLVTFTELRGYLVTQVDQQLQSVNALTVAKALAYCDTYRARDDVCNGPGQAEPGSASALPPNDYAQLVQSGQVVYGAWLAATTTPPSAAPQFPTDLPGGAFTVRSSTGASYRAVAMTVPFNPGYVVVVAQPLSGVEHDVGRLLLIEVLVSLAALVGLGALSWWLVRRELLPLRAMTATAGAIAAGDLSRRVGATDERTEVGQLGHALNVMLAEIEVAFAARAASEEQLRRFLADASHELRTPLTSIRGYAEMFDRGARDRPEDLELVMRRIRSEADRMGLLVEDLLLLSRLGQQRPIDVRPVDMAAVADEAVAAARASAPGRSVVLHAGGPAVVAGDPGRLRQVVDNLVRNALAYSPADSPVDVTVSLVPGAPAGTSGPAGHGVPAAGPALRGAAVGPVVSGVPGVPAAGPVAPGALVGPVVPGAGAAPAGGPALPGAAPVGGPGLPAVAGFGSGVLVTVADRGPGIAPADRQRIFQPFERLDPSRARATGGLGLGLAIVAAIVRAHGGVVWVTDRPGGGSVFHVQLVAGATQGVAGASQPVAGASQRLAGVLPSVAGVSPEHAGVRPGGAGYSSTDTGPAGTGPDLRRTTMGDDADRRDVDERTRAAEREEAFAAHQADRAATPDEEATAPAGVDESVSAHEHEMSRRGATVEGEGAI